MGSVSSPYPCLHHCCEVVGKQNGNMSLRETELTSGTNSSQSKRGNSSQEEQESEENEQNSHETDTLLPTKSLLLLPEEKILLTSNLVDDVVAVIYDVKFYAPLSALLFGIIGIFIVLNPFTSSPQRPNPMSPSEYVIHFLHLSTTLTFTFLLMIGFN